MLSYRFAIRLGHHVRIATARSKVQIRQRQVIPLSHQLIYTLHRAIINCNSSSIYSVTLLYRHSNTSIQMHLFSSCYQLLCDIKDLGGEDHATIRAAVLEQMADGHLSRVRGPHNIICTSNQSIVLHIYPLISMQCNSFF